MTGILTIASATIALASFSSTAPVSIEGAVKHPGLVYVTQSSTLKSTIDLAGGFAKNADLRSVQVRSAKGEVHQWNLYSLGTVATVEPGDTISVSQIDPKTVVFVEGPVANRAPIDYKAGLSLAEVLALSRPMNAKEMDRVIVTRNSENGATKTIYKADKLESSGPTILLMPGDLVTVPYARAVQTSDRELIIILLVALVIITIAR